MVGKLISWILAEQWNANKPILGTSKRLLGKMRLLKSNIWNMRWNPGISSTQHLAYEILSRLVSRKRNLHATVTFKTKPDLGALYGSRLVGD